MSTPRALLLVLGIGACLLRYAFGLDRVSPVDLEWKDVSCSIGKKHLLHGVSGKAGAGRLLAVMGPSGSGKTTLLNAIAGQVPYNKRTQLHGTLRVGGADRRADQDQAYVKQEDVFYSQLTVRETLLMAARLRLPSSMPLGDKTAMVDELINKLGLSKVADTIVGDEKTRGISGGERKRLSIASQLFGTPSLIFCDEPTTGLDSFQAERVMRTLKDLADDGHTVICVIHQPRSSIFRMLDDLIVLSEGRVVFKGPAKKVAGHFRGKGHAIPPDTNPAEFAIDVVSVDYASPDAEEKSKKRIANFASDFVPSTTPTPFSTWFSPSSAPSSGKLTGPLGSARMTGVPHGGGTGGKTDAEKPGRRAASSSSSDDVNLSTRSRRRVRSIAIAKDADATTSTVEEGGEATVSFLRRWRSQRSGDDGDDGVACEAGGGGRGAGKEVVVRRRPRNQRAGIVEQFRLLFSRSWRQVNRAKFANVTRVVANLGSAVIFGSIFWKLGLGQTHINDRVGLLQTAVIQCAMSTVAKTLVTFPAESTIVKAERSLQMYSVLPYFLSKMIAELPISALFPNIFGVILYHMTGLHPKRDRLMKFLGVLTIEAFAASALGMLIGCLAKDGDAAMAIGPPIMTIFILFSGFYITQDNVPRALRWVKDASLIKHAFEGLCVNELEGLEFECDVKSRGPCIRTGEQMLARVAFDKSTVSGATLSLSKILGGCWVLTYLALALGNPRFQTMLEPSLLAPATPTATAPASAAMAAKTVAGGGRDNGLSVVVGNDPAAFVPVSDGGGSGGMRLGRPVRAAKNPGGMVRAIGRWRDRRRLRRVGSRATASAGSGAARRPGRVKVAFPMLRPGGGKGL